MSVVAIDAAGARALGDELIASAARADDIHGRLLIVMAQVDLPTDAAGRLAAGRDALRALGTAVVDKADLAESFTVDPSGTAAALGAPENDLRSAVTALIGFAGVRSLRDVLQGLPPPGADPALDAAVARLTPALLPALLRGERPELPEESHGDLRSLALALGIASSGPRIAEPLIDGSGERAERGFLSRRSRARRSSGDTEVFHHDFWAGGRTPQQVLDDPDQLLTWVSETFELDRRLTLATEIPDLVDILQTHDFARSADTTVEQLVAEADEQFAAIAQYLPALLSGAAVPPPDPVQSDQIIAFATRVGWVDTTPGGVDDRLGDAVAHLAANRVLASALLPSAFDANGVDLPFFDETGIGFTLDLGVRRGVVDGAVITGIGATVDAVAAQLGIDLAAATPPPLDDAFQQEFLLPLVAGQIGPQGAASPSISLAFQQVLPYLRSAGSGAELRDHLIEALAAFRTLAVVGVPALTESQLTSLVGDDVVGVLGRSRLRRRSESFTRKYPEFVALAAQWGIPGSEKIKTKDHKFTFSFDDSGRLTAIRRKKRSFWSKASDVFKGFIKGIGDAFEENPLKAIFEVGKIALNVAALIFPGTQGLGIAAIAANAAGAVASAVEGDWLGALSNGLAVFTPGLGLGPVTDAISASQALVLDGLIDPVTLDLLRVAKSGVDTARAVSAAIDAESPLAALAAGAQALSTGLGGLGLATNDAALTRLATTFAEVRPVIAGVGGTLAAVDQGDVLAAVGNGLGTLAAGARALVNPAGASGLLGFDASTVATLSSLGQTSGVLGSLANAVAAADRGDLATIGSFLLQAVDQVTPDPALGVDPLKVATGIADLGAILERAIDAGIDSPALAGPVLQQLGVIAASLNPKGVNTRRPPQPAPDPRPVLTATAAELEQLRRTRAELLNVPSVSRSATDPFANPVIVDSADVVTTADVIAAMNEDPSAAGFAGQVVNSSAKSDRLGTGSLGDLEPALDGSLGGTAAQVTRALKDDFGAVGGVTVVPQGGEPFTLGPGVVPVAADPDRETVVPRSPVGGAARVTLDGFTVAEVGAFGEFASQEDKDSIEGLIAQITAAGISSTGVGAPLGFLFDIRDLLGSAYNLDALGVMASGASLVPGLGDLAAVGLRVARFVERNPELAGTVAVEVVERFPDIAPLALRTIYGGYDDLRRTGLSDADLVDLVRGGADLDRIAVGLVDSRRVVEQLAGVPADLQRVRIGFDPAAADFYENAQATLETGRVVEFPQGVLAWRDPADPATVVHVAALGAPVPRARFENRFHPRAEHGALPSSVPHDRAHSLGAGFGVESPYGLLYAPSIVNRGLQNQGIEDAIRQLQAAAAPGEQIVVSTRTRAIPGTMRLESVDYQVQVVRDGQTGTATDLLSYRIQVDGAARSDAIAVTASSATLGTDPGAQALLDRIELPAGLLLDQSFRFGGGR